MNTRPSIRPAWRRDPEDAQPTCYDARDPTRPWLPAAELGYDDAEDRADASAWLSGGGPAASIGSLQKCTAQPTTSQTGGASVPDLFQLSIIEQLAHKAQKRQN